MNLLLVTDEHINGHQTRTVLNVTNTANEYVGHIVCASRMDGQFIVIESYHTDNKDTPKAKTHYQGCHLSVESAMDHLIARATTRAQAREQLAA